MGRLELKRFNFFISLPLIGGLYLIAGCGFSVEPAKEAASGGLNALGFQVAANLETGAGMSFTPQVAVEPDGGGTAIAVWVKLEDPDTGDTDPRQVYRVFSSYHNGVSWGLPLVINIGTTAYGHAWSPKVSMDDNGDAMAVWQQSDGTTERVYARRFIGGSWGAVTELNVTFAGLSAASPAIAVEPDGGGDAMAVWSQMTSSNGWQTVARRFTAGSWGAANEISGGNSLTPASSPVVAMDNTGRAIAAFIRQVQVPAADNCMAPVTVADVGFAEDDTNTGTITCYESRVLVNQFSGGIWQTALNIGDLVPVSPTNATSESSGNTNKICFQTQNDDTGSGSTFEPDGENVAGENSACVTMNGAQIGMDRATGVAFVVVKIAWAEQEAAGGCSGAGTNNSDDEHGDGGGDQNDCAPSSLATDEWYGDAIVALRYDGAGWTTGDWSKTHLYAHSDQPYDAACDNGSANSTCDPLVTDKPVVSNCADRTVIDEGARYILNCKLNSPQIAISGDAGGTALAVWERYDGTNDDLYADCYTLTSVATCGGGATTGWRSFFTAPAAGSSTPTVTTPYAVLNDTAVSREAYAPHVALDSTGNGLAVWTQKDATGRWRVYGMRFESGIGFDTATRTTIDNYTVGDLYYFSPVVAMEWVNTGNADPPCPVGFANCGSAWTMFLESQLTLGGILPALNIRVRGNQWTP